MVHLAARSLSFQREGRALFSSLSLALKAGQVCRIEGPNGSGKTTLLRILSGLISDYEGKVCWCDKPISTCRNQFSEALLYLGHRTGVKTALTPFENLQAFIGLSARAVANAEACCWQALNAVGLVDYADVPVARLSAGQQRRVALARLHLHDASLWLLDEPFTAVDHRGTAQLEQWLQDHRAQGGIAILTSHQPLQQITPDIRLCLDGQGGHDIVA